METSSVKHLLLGSWQILLKNAGWMGWNLFLAVVPLLLSVVLFRRTQLGKSTLTLPPIALQERHRSLLWWLGVMVFIAFLPNAPYILTDIIHFIDDVNTEQSVLLITLAIVPLYGLFIAAGFEAYVLSLINLGHYLHHRGLTRYILVTEIMIHVLSAVGIYLGRFLRFNSWDIVTRLDDLTMVVLDDLLGKRPLLAITVTFIIVMGLYTLLKPVNLALAAYWKTRRDRLKSANFC